MAGRGFAPGTRGKDPSQLRRRNLPAPVTVLVADGKTHGPELPDSYDWPEATVAWWQAWRTCAQASRFAETDWLFLVDTAVLHAEFWLGDRSVAGELRLRVAKFGATVEDRARLKFAIGEPDGPSAPAVKLRTKAQESRRARVLRAVSDGRGQGISDAALLRDRARGFVPPRPAGISRQDG
jgi:hypothetical protein